MRTYFTEKSLFQLKSNTNMRVAIVHYHLRPGGVTKVIQNALSALSGQDLQTVVIAGEPPSPDMAIAGYVVAESLRYSTSPHLASEYVVKTLKAAAKQQLGGLPDVWHIHNHALGKNLVLPRMVHLLAQQGQHLLLQPHDFAEDGRPQNYKFLRDHLCPTDQQKFGAQLYPQGSHIHYALINQRDLNFLKTSGVAETQLHYLPNAVSVEQSEETEAFQPQEEFYVFYPARAIRRKNIGEFLLWAALEGQDKRFAVARSPKNPLARPIYDDWVTFAHSLDLPVQFEVGEQWQGDFTTLLRSARALMTTSVAEGFGLAFLEPWLVQRPLIGRDLPEITATFQSSGIDLSPLYSRIDVPLEWVGKNRFQQEVATNLCQVYAMYGREVQPDDIERAVNASITNDAVDFGKLNEPLQQLVIQRLAESPAEHSSIDPSSLEQAIRQGYQNVEHNYTTITQQFNLQTYRERLMKLYHTVADSEGGTMGEFHAEILLDQFLAPERFSLLRT